MNIIGLSAFYHESACCLLQDGRLAAAAAEERFTRLKYDARLPVRAFRFCLEQANLSPADIDCLAYYELPALKAERQRFMGAEEVDPDRPFRLIRRHLGYDGPIQSFAHHHSHAASAFLYSGFPEAAILTVDGVGEWATTGYGHGRETAVDLFETVDFPHSLGLLYAALTAYLGFRVNSGEYKVMGLAAYGRPRFFDALNRLVQPGEGGQYSLAMDYFDYVHGRRMYSDALIELLGRPPRRPDETIAPFHQDVAASLQLVLEEQLLAMVRYLAQRVNTPNLCLAGGVALNCVANGRLRREGPFESIFIQPAAGDAGGCLGAAALAHIALTGRRHSYKPLQHVYLGPTATQAELTSLLAAAGLPAQNYHGRPSALMADTAVRLQQGQIIGWFQGAMEFGPRALGHRSILASPLLPEIKDRLNRRIKQREGFRPFAPAVLAHRAGDYFALDHPSSFMLETCQVNDPRLLPAISHVDSSARPQTVDPAVSPRFAALLAAFERLSGHPVLLNTSLNIRGEPIVCTPVDALFCLVRANLDALVLGDFLIERSRLPNNLPELLAGWETSLRPAAGFRDNLYTFV